jgi:molybdate transport system substrate-binding protein
MIRIFVPSAAALALFAGAAHADKTNVAVAANFTEPAREIAAAFKAATGHEAVLSFGSTGQLYAQITQEAPFEVFLAADDARPEMAVEAGLAVEDSVFTYAVGRLVLWSPEPGMEIGDDTLKSGAFDKIAIANPGTAPYGAAAIEVMEALDVLDELEPKIVRGNSVAQAYQFVVTGNAELGFVASSQVIGNDGGSVWEVATNFYEPILQDAVLLNRGAESEAARAFMDYLQGHDAAEIIARYGYDVSGRD